MAKTRSTATAPPRSPTITRASWEVSDEAARRSTALASVPRSTSATVHVVTHASVNDTDTASASRRPSSPPAGRPSARAGRIAEVGPVQPYDGSDSHTLPTITATD